MNLIHNVTIADNRGQDVNVTAVISDDKKFAAAAATRVYVGDWKDSSTGSGNQTRPVGFGDLHIFRVDNYSEDGTAELTHIQGPMPIRVNEIRNPQGDISVSINSYLSDKVGLAKTAKLFKDITNPSIQQVVNEAINIAAEEMVTRQSSVGGQMIFARAANAFASKVKVADQRKKPKIVQITSVSEGASTSREVLPD